MIKLLHKLTSQRKIHRFQMLDVRSFYYMPREPVVQEPSTEGSLHLSAYRRDL